MNEPRPTTISALPFERRSRVANSWKTRTGSAALSTVTALVSRIRRVRAAAAARITVGAEALEKFQLLTAHRGENFVHCPVGFCVQINNTGATFFCRDQNGVGRNEPDTAEIGIKLYERFRLV